MEARAYQVSDQAAFVALSQCVNTHFASVTEPCRARGVGVTVSLPSPESGAVLDSIVSAVAKSNPHLLITQIRRGTAYLNLEKESVFGTNVRPEHSIAAGLRDILDSLGKPKTPGSAPSMTGQIAEMWPHLEPLEQRITLAELMKNTPMTRAEVQAQITGLIERLVAEAVKERQS